MGWEDTIKPAATPQQSSGGWESTVKPSATVKEPTTRENIHNASQTVQDFGESFIEGLPMAGLLQKYGRLGAAGAIKAGSYFGEPDHNTGKSFDQIYGEMTDRDEADKQRRSERSPVASKTGFVAGAVAAPNPASVTGRVGLNVLDSATRANNPQEALENAGTAGLVSAGFESLPLLGKAAKGLGGKLDDVADKAAVKATGAPGSKAQKFKDNAGRELREQGVVKFGRNQEGISKAARGQLDAAYQEIDSSLKQLDDMGGMVHRDEILAELNKEKAALGKRPSQRVARDQLDQRIQEVQEGPETYTLSAAEAEKREYQHQANYDLDNASQRAKKKVASIWQNAVEKKALAMNPDLGETFKVGKQRFGVFAPIEEAAAKKAAQQQQSGYGDLGDIAAITSAAAIPAMSGQPLKAALYGAGGMAAKRLLAPRIPASISATSGAMAKLMDSIGSLPEKYQGLLTGSPEQIATTHFLLSKQDPEYRKLMGQEDK